MGEITLSLVDLPTHEPWRRREILKRYRFYYIKKGYSSKDAVEMAWSALRVIERQEV